MPLLLVMGAALPADTAALTKPCRSQPDTLLTVKAARPERPYRHVMVPPTSRSMPDYRIEMEHGGRVAGVDEVGRGPLAGPVVAAAVVFPSGLPPELALMLDDSKKLTPVQRDLAYRALFASGAAEIGIGAASVAEISHLNILHAALLAMRRAVARLPHLPDLALIDGNTAPDLPCPARCVVGGDALCLSIAAASIVAKVVRDRAMARLAARWPQYGWQSNAGYGTAAHRVALARHGPCRHHRPTFGAVRRHLAATAAVD